MKRFHFIPCILLLLCAVLVFTACSAEETKQLPDRVRTMTYNGYINITPGDY